MNQELGIPKRELGIRNHESRVRRIARSLILYSLFLILAMAIAPPAQAVVVPTTDPATAAIAAQIAKHEIKATVGARMLGSAVVGLINATTKFAQQLAYDVANSLASGAAGQNPFAFVDDLKQSATWKKYAFDAAGEFIGNLSGPWEELGLNICTPRIPEIGIAIQLGLVTQMGQRPAPKCDFGSVLNNWSQISREVQDPNALLKKVSLAFEPTQTDLGQAFKAQEGLRFKVAENRRALELARLAEKGILPKVGLISGKVETPAVVLEERFRKLATAGEEQVLTAKDVVGATIGTGSSEIWVGAAGAVWNTFVNTLISKSLNLALQGLFKPAVEALPDLTKFIGGSPPKAGGATLNPAAVALLTPQIRTSESTLEYLSDLAACPDKKLATQFQCTIDQKFAAALQQSRSGNPLTVAEAADPKNGYLDRAKPFGFVNPATGQEPDYTLGYPYSSMKKLRLLRILPVGWEFAALKLKELNLPPKTLGDVLDGWNDPNSPFEGLVDPNWVLKAPTATCGALTWSEVLDGSGVGRQEACADLKHCVSEDALGTCKAYGYCTREKNSWAFDGDSCAPQFASCDTFKSAGGEELSLLENTVDFGSCNAGNAGCTRYAERQFRDNSTGQFNWSAADEILFDRDAQTCTPKDEGCTEFIAPTPEVQAILDDGEGESGEAGQGKLSDQYPTTAQKSYYRAPPAYLGCTGEEGEPEECRTRGYARVCRQDEAGCAQYSPVSGDPAVPAVANALDRCPSECAGYNTYIKQSSTFEPQFLSEGLYLIIPQNARQCEAAAAGCEEFTNLADESRQYFTDLRACQKPAPDDQTYFTWEGSDTTGYQLKSWVLKKSNAGAVGGEDVDVLTAAPAIPPCTNYALASGATAGETIVTCTDDLINQAACDPQVGDPDCRSFYDERGNIFYRKFSRTIVSTAECTSYRWSGFTTLPEVSGLDRAALEQLACDDGHGFWNKQTNQCLYVGAPSQSLSCSAQFNGCRGYSGNAGANVQVVLSESFEGGLQGWTGGTLSSESLYVQQHSLKVTSGSASRSVEDANAAGQTFLVNFLAKGTVGTNLTVKIGEVALGTVALTPSWQTFSLGPKTAATANPNLTFAGQGTFFIDEVQLKVVVDTVYLVKNSWNIPVSCDTLPAEVGGGLSRGAMLGCSEYRTADNKTEYFKSFSNLCRPQAVGCTDLIDTRNSDSPFEEIINQNDELPNIIDDDDALIKADEHRYLVVKPAVVCQAAQKGCQALGKSNEQGILNTIYLKNDPARYATDLCTIEDEGCEAWSRQDKSVAYFKQPVGGACEWRTGVKIGTINYSGWFRKNASTPTPCYDGNIQGNTFGIWRNADPGYTSALASGRRVGLCPPDQATCTEFRDPTDTANSPLGTAYYFKDNERLKEARSGCPNGASRQVGCVLFNNTEILAKPWSAPATYALSEQKGGVPVSPLSSGSANDTNTLLKVKRDRSCAQWYQCASAQWVWDEQKSQFRSVCHQQALCNELAPTPVAPGASSDCIGYVQLTRKNTPFDRAEYLARDRTFAGQEYVGYSVPNLYPLGLLEEEEENSKFKLGYKTAVRTLTGIVSVFKAPDGTNSFGPTPGLSNFWSTSCRGYPEANSPFPSTEDVKNNYKNAPKCSMVGPNGQYKCECSYKGLDYGGTFRYFEPDFDKAPAGICLGSSGTTKTDCEKGSGTWQPQTGENNAVGWLGYCLERDESRVINASKDSRACLTWWPVDRIKAAPDVYNQFAQAGYTFPNGYGRYFCLLGSFEFTKTILSARTVIGPRKQLQIIEVPVNDKIYKSDIREFIVRTGAQDVDDLGALASAIYTMPANNASDPNQDLKYDTGVALSDKTATEQSSDSPKPCAVGDTTTDNDYCWGYYTRANSDPEDQFRDWWWWVGDDNSQWGKINQNISLEDDGDSDGRGTGPGSPLSNQLAAQVASTNLKEPFPNACNPYDDSYDGVAVLLHFTPAESEDPYRLDKIRIGVCSGEKGQGSGYEARVDVDLHLHPHCEYLYKVDPTPGSSASAPRTHNLYAESNTEITYAAAITSQPRKFLFSTPFTPFGSSSQNTNRDPTQSSHPWFLNHNRLEDPQGTGIQTVPFAGWPWGCGATFTCTVNSRLSLNGSMATSGVESPFVFGPYATVIEDITTADLFGKLFAKGGPSQLFKWNSGKYESAPASLQWDYTDQGHTPIISAPTKLSTCTSEGICQDSFDPILYNNNHQDIPPFAVNGAFGSGEPVSGVSGPGFFLATAQFHVRVNNDQMPLRKITVDWGDGTVTSGDGLYQNYMGLKSDGSPWCDGSGAGKILNKSCKTAFYAYDHRYACKRPAPGETVPGWANSAPACTDNGFTSGCCIFTPKVQVQDNWGWCNNVNAPADAAASCAGAGQQFWSAIVVGPRQ